MLPAKKIAYFALLIKQKSALRATNNDFMFKPLKIALKKG